MRSTRAASQGSIERRSILRAGPLAALSVPALGALAACGGDGGGGDAGDGTGELNLIYMGDATQQERSEEHTSELQSRGHLVCRLLLEKKKTTDSSRETVH